MKLTPLQARVYTTLRRGEDTPIPTMHKAAYPSSHQDGASVRTMQMRLGSLVQRLNERLAARNLKVVPGRTKQTYTIQTVEQDT